MQGKRAFLDVDVVSKEQNKRKHYVRIFVSFFLRLFDGVFR